MSNNTNTEATLIQHGPGGYVYVAENRQFWITEAGKILHRPIGNPIGIWRKPGRNERLLWHELWRGRDQEYVRDQHGWRIEDGQVLVEDRKGDYRHAAAYTELAEVYRKHQYVLSLEAGSYDPRRQA